MVLLVPRLDGKYASVGTLATVEQVGRLAAGIRPRVVRAVRRVRIGTGTTGPGAALWVEASAFRESDAGIRWPGGPWSWSGSTRRSRTQMLRKRGAWQFVDRSQPDRGTRRRAGRQRRLRALPDGRAEAQGAAGDRRRRRAAGAGRSGWREHLAELEVAETIRKDVQEGMDKQQREFLLRQQLAAVRKELAELNGDPADEEQDYRARVEAAELPEKVREAALEEVDKLERTSDQSPEGGWIRTWLDTVLELPWNRRTEDAYDIAGARAVLDADHAGLDDVKERIVEYLAVRKRRADRGLGVGGRSAQRGGARAGRAARCRQDLARRVASRGRWAGTSSGSRSAASGTRRRSAATGAPTSARCRAGSCGPSRRPAR